MQGGQGTMKNNRMSTSSREGGDSGEENDGDWELEGVKTINRKKGVLKSTRQQQGFLDTIASFFPFVCGGDTSAATGSPRKKRRKSNRR